MVPPFTLGRLLQVEYAVEAIQQTGSTVGLLTTEGVAIVAEKNELSKMLEKGKIPQDPHRQGKREDVPR